MHLNSTAERRFWSKVDKNGPTPAHCPHLGPCWIWTGSKSLPGYGHFSTSRALSPVLAHRVSWVLRNGPIPPGMFICHHCDNPSCVQPDHLFQGTCKDNVADMITKGRQSPHIGRFQQRGELHGAAKLTERDVIEIRRLYASERISHAKLSCRFG